MALIREGEGLPDFVLMDELVSSALFRLAPLRDCLVLFSQRPRTHCSKTSKCVPRKALSTRKKRVWLCNNSSCATASVAWSAKRRWLLLWELDFANSDFFPLWRHLRGRPHTLFGLPCFQLHWSGDRVGESVQEN